jgi:chemotaxis protein methyltransferase CheR
VESLSIKSIELDLLLEAIYRQYGYDFRDYAKPSIERRLQQFIELEHIASISDLIKPLLHNREFAFRLIKRFSINVSEMFRDPYVYRSMLKLIIPILRTYPSFKIWHAGCADGQEVYSLAILLKEAGILDRATIFATDINEEALDTAKNGIYPIFNIQSACKSYKDAGGKNTFTNYFHAAYNAVTMNKELKRRITFANHNLVDDASFGEMHLILCRNVLIYFNPDLQERAWKLFNTSLVDGGFICLGPAEDLPHTDISRKFGTIDSSSRIYNKPAKSSEKHPSSYTPTNNNILLFN